MIIGSILIYVIIGLCLSFYGPLAKTISEKLEASIPRSEISSQNVIKAKIAIRVIICLFYPILYIVFLIDYVRKIKEPNNNEYHLDSKLLYFSQMPGAGAVECKDCGYQEDVFCSWHGHGDERWSISGYQCQSCGKFHNVKNAGDGTKTKIGICDCGGILKNKCEIFCSSCKGKNMEYHFRLMT